MNNPKYILLRGITLGNKFFSLNGDPDPTKLYDGTVAYEIIGYADTVREAQIKLFGYSTTTAQD